jgi:DNA-binding SARP family transcriptional activator/AcrR family transcriptional regulator
MTEAPRGAVANRELRKDAARNRAEIVECARRIFAAEGLDVPMGAIAKAAGVGAATLQRRFPSRGDLIEACMAEQMEGHLEAAEAALSDSDPWKGFVDYLTAAFTMQARDRGLSELLAGGLPCSLRLEALRRKACEAVEVVMSRAQAAGRLRRDVDVEAIPLLLIANAGVVRATVDAAPDAWRQMLHIVIDGLRVANGELPASGIPRGDDAGARSKVVLEKNVGPESSLGVRPATVEGQSSDTWVRLLGPLEAMRDGALFPLGRTAERTLLVLLAVRGDAGLTQANLAYELWEESPPPGAATTIRGYVTRLRRAIDNEAEGSLVVAAHGSYRLRPGAYQSDVHEFERLVALGKEVSEPDERSERLRRALGLWRGRACANVKQTPLIVSEVHRLDELRLRATEDRIDAEMDLGLHREVIAELQDLVAMHPLNESLWRMLMLSLYRSGRQAEALRAAQAERRLLREELGIDPKRGLGALEHAILIRDPGLDWHPTKERRRRSRSRSVLPPSHMEMGILAQGREMLSAGSFEEARSLLTIALGSAGEATDEAGREFTCDLLLGLAEARRGARDLVGAQSAALAAADLAREDASAPRLAMAAIWATSLNAVGHPDEAVEALCREALDSLGTTNSKLRAEVLAGLADYLGFASGDGDGAIEAASAALVCAAQSGDAAAVARSLFLTGEVLDWTSRVTERILIGERLVADGRMRGDLISECDGLYLRALARLALGSLSDFDHDRLRLEEVAVETSNWYRQLFPQVWRVMRELLEGRFGAAEVGIGGLVGSASHEPNVQNLAFGQLFVLRREQGRMAELRPVVEQQARQEPRIASIACFLALTLAEIGQRAEASRCLEMLVDAETVRAPHDLTWTTSLCLLAETAAALGDPRAAAPLLEQLAPYQGQLAVLCKGMAVTGAADRYIGLLQAVLGNEAARSSFEAALRLESSLGAPPLIARTKVCFGQWLCGQPSVEDRRRGDEVLEEGRGIARRLGMAALAAT